LGGDKARLGGRASSPSRFRRLNGAPRKNDPDLAIPAVSDANNDVDREAPR